MYEIGTKLIRVIPTPYSDSVPIGSICKLRSYMDDHMFCEIVSLPASCQPSKSRPPRQVGDIILTRVDHWKLNTPKILKARKCQHS